MDFKEYIESGKLESYVLGICTPEESQEAECMARIFPEVKRELELMRTTFEQYAIANKSEPPAALKSKIFAAIEEEEKKSKNIADAKVVSMAPKTPSGNASLRFMMAACVAMLIVSVFIAFNLYNKNHNLAQQVNQMQSQQQTALQNYSNMQQQLENTQRQMLVMNDPHTLPVTMKGLPLSPQSLATIYWNKDSKDVYIAVNSLPQPPSGKQYQLWAIVNGTPVDLGVFNVPALNDSLLQKMKSVDGVVAFAVTLEKSGGNPIPTMNEMYVMGNI